MVPQCAFFWMMKTGPISNKGATRNTRARLYSFDMQTMPRLSVRAP